MQVIYDSKGTIFMQGSGFSKPEGDLTYTEISIPENQHLGHQLERLDNSPLVPDGTLFQVTTLSYYVRRIEVSSYWNYKVSYHPYNERLL